MTDYHYLVLNRILPQPHFYPLNNIYLFYLNTPKYILSIKKIILKFRGMMAHKRTLIPLVSPYFWRHHIFVSAMDITDTHISYLFKPSMGQWIEVNGDGNWIDDGVE
jgi:hypothetical protein